MIPSTVSLLLLAISLTSVLERLESHPEVLWANRLNESRQLLFLPEEFFQDVQISQLPLPERSMKALSAQLAADPKCRQAATGDIVVPEGAARPRPSLVDVIKRNQVAVLARVERIVPGWIVPYGYAGSLVQVLILESFKSAESRFSPESRASYLEQMGSLRVGDRVLCTNDRNRSLPGIGAEILIVGGNDPFNARLIATNSSFLLPVADGIVFSPAESATDGQPIKLEAIREAVRDVP